jgi:hypothetical protein
VHVCERECELEQADRTLRITTCRRPAFRQGTDRLGSLHPTSGEVLTREGHSVLIEHRLFLRLSDLLNVAFIPQSSFPERTEPVGGVPLRLTSVLPRTFLQ